MVIIDEKSKEIIKSLIDHAYENKISLEDMYEIAEGKKDPIGDSKEFCCRISKDIRIVFSVEQHPTHLMKHISISKNFELPDFEDVVVIIKEFGFVNEIQDCVVYKEGKIAINVLEVV